MADNWFSQIQSKIYTQVTYMLKKKYKNLNCTTSNENETPATFPTLYLHELAPLELGQDLTNESVNAIRCTIEIQVWASGGVSAELDCRNILTDASLEMKRLNFNISAMPSIQTTNKIAWGVIRCTRVIGAADKIAQ